jgi:hypothetical protein
MPRWALLQSRGRVARHHAEAFLAEIHLPHMPSVEEIRGYAEARLARTVSLDEIARRTRQILLAAIAVRLLMRLNRTRHLFYQSYTPRNLCNRQTRSDASGYTILAPEGVRPPRHRSRTGTSLRAPSR